MLGAGREKAGANLRGVAVKVVVVYQYFQGRDTPGHSLIYELARFLSERGHDVTVVAGETGYMQRNSSTLPWYRRIVRRELDGKVKVVRTYTYSQLHRSYLGRLLSFISFSISCPIGLLLVTKPDVVLASSPPIFPIFTAWLTCKIRRIPVVLEVRDLWPASAVQMGILRNKQLIEIMAWMERVLYDRSAIIVALTEGIRESICSRGWLKSKVKLITCGADFDELYPDANAAMVVREKHRWQDKKIVLYFGALGESNNLSVMLRAAQRLISRRDITFVLIGDGMKRIETEEQAVSMGLENILVLPPVPKDEARLYINAADLCLVTLKDIPLFTGAIPTKMIDYMACGKAMLCGVRGEAEHIVRDAGAGVLFEPDDDEQLSGAITSLLNDGDLAAEMGARGLAYVKNRFSAVAMREQMESVLLMVCKDGLGNYSKQN